MSKTTSTVLGISLGTRNIGVAIICDTELLFWKVKTFNQAWSSRKLKDILFALDCIAQFETVNGLSVKEPDLNTRSDALTQLISEVTAWGKRKGYPISFHTLTQLKKKFGNYKGTTKVDVMRRISELFPEVSGEFKRELKNKNPYYDKLFEAIGLAVIANESYPHRNG